MTLLETVFVTEIQTNQCELGENNILILDLITDFGRDAAFSTLLFVYTNDACSHTCIDI